MRTFEGKGLGKSPNGFYWLTEFDSPYELAEFADAVEHRYKSMRYEPHYNLTESWDDMMHLARHGWHDIRAKVDGHLAPLREQLGEVLAIVQERYLDMTGYEPDIERYLAGELECMFEDRMLEQPKDGKVFRLVVDVSMTWGNSADQIAKRGATLAALTEAYILLGLQLEVWAEFTVRGAVTSNKFASCLTRLTHAGDPLDVDQLMFCIGHPDFGRRLMWAWGEGTDITRTEMGFTQYGYYGYHQNGVHFADRIGASSTVSLDGNRAMESNPVQWILQQLEAQGIYEGGE